MEEKPMFINKGELISDPQYYAWIEDLKTRYHSAQAKAAVSVNTEMLRFYWSLGRDTICLKAESKWGAGILRQLSLDLRTAFPNSTGFSYTNIKRIVQWYRFYFQEITNRPQVGGDLESLFRPQVGGELEMPEIFGKVPFRHHTEIVAKAQSLNEAFFYIEEDIKGGWSRSILESQLDNNLYTTKNKAITNFERELPADFVPKANEIVKDPYYFSFLNLSPEHSEQELEDGLVRNITRFLLELGHGFAFVGRQVELKMDNGTSFFPDLLFYNYHTKNFVVCELKASKFIPEYAGKLNFYVKAVDELLRGAGDNPTIGILICKSKNKTVVDWSLSDIHKPLGVASYELQKHFEESLHAMLEAEGKNVMMVHHVGIYVPDLEATKDFYQKYFDAISGELYENPSKGFKSYFLTIGEGARIEIMTRKGIEGNNSLGNCHISIKVGSKEAVDTITAQINADGYEVIDGPRTTGDGYYESQIRAIDGNIVEITE